MNRFFLPGDWSGELRFGAARNGSHRDAPDRSSALPSWAHDAANRSSSRAAFCGGLLLLLAGNLDAGNAPAYSQPAKRPCCTNDLPAAAFTDKSIYQVESTWTTDAGKRIKLSELHGQTQIVAMFFASCEYACPLIVHDMKRIQAALPEKLRSNVGFVLVTFDHQRDKPAALSAYRKKQALDETRWKLLHGGPDDIRELAALLGVKYKRDARGNFAHSNLITVLDPNGEIVHQQVGLNQEIQETVKTIESLATKEK